MSLHAKEDTDITTVRKAGTMKKIQFDHGGYIEIKLSKIETYPTGGDEPYRWG
jgi:hypothetical protein